MEEIRNWLDDKRRDYMTGVMLLSKFAPGQRMIPNFLKMAVSPSQYYKEKLIYELEKICPRRKIVKPTTLPKIVYNPGDPRAPEIKIVQQPVILSTKIIPEGAKELHKEHSFVHEQLRNAKSDAMRLKCAKRIMQEIIPSLDALYQGKELIQSMPIVEIPIEQLSPLDIHKKIANIRTSISKTKAKIAQGRPELLEKLNEYTQALHLLMKTQSNATK
ncbi:MAG: hypothetical protein LCH44_13955 [Bacteroidetes bacterium]|nr:hypothetical protein [Bacteroidota bacterium]